MVAPKINLLTIVGPTASGKTSLSINIAKKYDGEIISADSRAVYKYLDIGSAKPSKEEQDGVPHWGFDLVGPGQTYTVADFKEYADDKIQDIQSRGKLPILVGGTGLYVDAVLYDYSLAPKNIGARDNMGKLSIEELQSIIKSKKLKMPENVNNKRYLIRTIERDNSQLTKKPLSKSSLIIGICPGKQVLNSRIELRLKVMLENGVIDEILSCSDKYGWDSIAMTGGIYKSFKGYLAGGTTLEEAKASFIKSDRVLAKKQMTWFKRSPDINWFDSAQEAQNWFDKHFGGKL